MLSGSGGTGQMDAAWGWWGGRGGGGGGWGCFWFHWQLIKLQQPSVAALPLEDGEAALLGPLGHKCPNSNGQPPLKWDMFASTFN